MATWVVGSVAGALAAALLGFGTLGYLLAAQPLIGQALLWSLVGAGQWAALRLQEPTVRRFGTGTAIGLMGGLALGFPIAVAFRGIGPSAPIVAMLIVVASAIGLTQGIALTESMKRRSRAIALHTVASAIGAMLGALTALAVATYVLGAEYEPIAAAIRTTAVATTLGAAVYGLITGWTAARIVADGSRSGEALPR